SDTFQEKKQKVCANPPGNIFKQPIPHPNRACHLSYLHHQHQNTNMEFKRNESTLNRPEGDRVLDAPYVFIDIPSYIDQVKQEKAWEKNDRNGITVYKSDRVTIVITALQAGAEIR